MPPRMRVLMKGPFVSASYDARKQRRLWDYESAILRHRKDKEKMEIAIQLSEAVLNATHIVIAQQVSRLAEEINFPVRNYFYL